MSNVRELRVLIHHRDKFRSLCKIAFSNRDASIYLFPESANHRYFFGSRSMPDTEFTDTFDFSEDLFATSVPKLSIHESGQVHVIANKIFLGPLSVPPLSSWRGEHLATVCPDSLTALPEYQRALKNKGQSIDGVIEVGSDTVNLRLAIYLAGDRPAFQAAMCPTIITLTRSTITNPLYIALKPVSQSTFDDANQPGNTIISGWNPTNRRKEGHDFLYIRGM